MCNLKFRETKITHSKVVGIEIIFKSKTYKF